MLNKDTKKLNVYSKNNQTIFSNNKFIIPKFQRNYTWGYKEIENLIYDLNMIENEYFFGNLIVKKDKENKYEVIDGQQRLITFYLMFKYIGNITISDDAIIFQLREKSNRTIREIGRNFLKDAKLDNAEYSEEIIEGYRSINAIIENKYPDMNNNNLINKLGSAIMFLIEVPEKTDLNHYFEIMNTRGEQLEQHDIVKASLISRLESKQDKELFMKIWDSCSDMNRYIQMSFTMRDPELRTKIFGDNWDKFEITDFDDLYQKYYSTNEERPINDYDDDIWNILNNNLELTNIENDKSKENEEDYRFDSIINFSNFLLHSLTTFANNNSNNEDDNSLEEIKLISKFKEYFKDKNHNDIKKFVMHLFKCKFYFDNYIIKRDYQKADSEDGEWSLLKLRNNDSKPSFNDSFGNKNKANLMIQSCMRITFTSPKSMRWITLALDKQNMHDTVEILKGHAIDKLPKKKGFQELKGFHFPHICFTYLDYLLLEKNFNKDFKFQYRTSIEHFYPQNPIEGHEKLEDKSLNSFGNLALITINGNSKLSCLDPSLKVEFYPEIIKQSLKLEEMKEKFENYNDINDLKDRIEKHCEEMLQILYPE